MPIAATAVVRTFSIPGRLPLIVIPSGATRFSLPRRCLARRVAQSRDLSATFLFRFSLLRFSPCPLCSSLCDRRLPRPGRGVKSPRLLPHRKHSLPPFSRISPLARRSRQPRPGAPGTDSVPGSWVLFPLPALPPSAIFVSFPKLITYN